jgi:hypothetical protein
VSCSLLERTRPEFYSKWAAEARERGLTENQITRRIAREIRECALMAAGKCPQCLAPIARYVPNPPLQGPSDVPGVWIQYRCSTAPPPGTLRPEGACDFMVDFKESEEL